MKNLALPRYSPADPLRVAIIGKAFSFGTYETLALLGRECCLARIDRVLARL